MTTEALQRYRFRPRFRGLAWTAIGLGALLLGASAVFGLSGASLAFAIATGAAGAALGALYLASPTWRIEVQVTDDALEVLSSGDRRFRLGWGEIRRVIASPDTRTCFVDGGDPDRSLIVPGEGAHAPYDIEHREALFDAILARVPEDVVETVRLLEDAAREDKRPAGDGERRD